ncbi:hypothetical protein BZA77DRAFT_4011 [Pyronema omphalodes]|nr:hypothetical protein BZA77DRAFT_4011 [Pyronema omphalodes]
MSGRADQSGSPDESVSPRVIVPVVTVVAVVVLIVFALAVFVMIRAYNRRRKQAQEKKDASRWRNSADSEGAWHNQDLENGLPQGGTRMASLERPRSKEEAKSKRSTFILKAPVPAAFRMTFQSAKRDSVKQDSVPRNGKNSESAHHDEILGSPKSKYAIESGFEDGSSCSTNRMTSGTLGKLEQITGSQFSNSIYDQQYEEQQETAASLDREQLKNTLALPPRRRRRSISQPNLRINIPPVNHGRSLSVNTDISPATTNGDFEFSPISPTSISEAMSALAPPPPASASTAFPSTYPNIAALTQANINVSNAILSRQSLNHHPSFTGLSISREHSGSGNSGISGGSGGRRATQYHSKLSPQFSPRFSPPLRNHEQIQLDIMSPTGQIRRYSNSSIDLNGPALSATFGNFDHGEYENLNSRPLSMASSIGSFCFGRPGAGEENSDGISTQRHSWNGRSVLLLDDPNLSTTSLRPIARRADTDRTTTGMSARTARTLRRAATTAGRSPSPSPMPSPMPSPHQLQQLHIDHRVSMNFDKSSIYSAPNSARSSLNVTGGLAPAPIRNPPMQVITNNQQSRQRAQRPKTFDGSQGFAGLEGLADLRMEMGRGDVRDVDREPPKREDYDQRMMRRNREMEEEDFVFQPERASFVFL